MGWLKRIASIVCGQQTERELNEEPLHHIELKTQENIAAGMPRSAPRAGAGTDWARLAILVSGEELFSGNTGLAANCAEG